MTDIVDKQTRSRMMAGIRGRNTKPEVVLRRALHARGYRFRLHSTRVPGKPDILLAKYNAAVFVHGCFWHRHAGCKYTTTPSTRREFWQNKFSANVSRDEAVQDALKASGWRVAIVWECSLRHASQIESATDQLSNWLKSKATEIEIGEVTIN